MNKKQILDNISKMLDEYKDRVSEDYFIITDDGKKKTSEILDECRKLFPVWSCYDEQQLDRTFLPVKTSYKYKKGIEADENLKNKSANDLDKEGIRGITLRERLLMELQYFIETGNHLDIENITLCSGSRDGDGFVPCVGWRSDGKLGISWCYPDGANDGLRSRQQFTL